MDGQELCDNDDDGGGEAEATGEGEELKACSDRDKKRDESKGDESAEFDKETEPLNENTTSV